MEFVFSNVHAVYPMHDWEKKIPGTFRRFHNAFFEQYTNDV